MQVTGRRLVLRARTISQCRFSQSSRQVARTRTNVQWQRQFSCTQYLRADGKNSDKTDAPRPTPAATKSKPEVLRDEDEFKVLSKDATPGEGQELFAKDVNEGLDSLEDFQAELGVSDAELDRLMMKFPGIDLKLVEQLKQGNMKESQVRQILKERYPNGPPESAVDKDAIGEISDLEDYIKLIEKMNTETLSPKERDRLQVLHTQIMQDPEVRQAILDGVVAPEEIEPMDSKGNLEDLADLALKHGESYVPETQDTKSPARTSRGNKRQATSKEQQSTEITASGEEEIPGLFDMPEFDDEVLADLSAEERDLLQQMKRDPELMQMIQTESMVDFAEQLSSGQFSADFLMGLSEEERQGLEQMRNDPEFLKSMAEIPTRLQDKMAASPELVDRARKLGEKLGLKSQDDMLLSLPEYENLLGEIDQQAAKEDEEGQNDEDEDEEDEDLDGLSVEELEERLAEAREDPEFRKFEREMEEELERKFGQDHAQFKTLRKRMLNAHLVKYAKAKSSSNLSGRSRSLAGIYGGPSRNPVRRAFDEGRASVLDKEIDLYTENPSLLFEYMEQLGEMREDYDDQYDTDDAFARRMDAFDRSTATEADNQIENMLENIDPREDMGIMGEPDDDFQRNPEPGFWNYEEDPAEEWGEDESFDSDDISALAHAELELHREIRQYARYTTWELPLLHKLAKEYKAPNVAETPLRFRYTTYMGESHPAARKVVVEFSPANLPLTPDQRITLCKLLGNRYNPDKDLVKMSCESFETQAQNKRYLGDTIAKLMQEARDGVDKFADVPLDTRHVKRKPVYTFPKAWRMTAEKRAQIDNGRKEIAAREKQRLVEGKVVDGVTVIQRAMRQRLLERSKEPVMVPAGAKKRLA